MSDNYVLYHLHSDASNPSSSMSMDSITKFEEYINAAEKNEMTAICFSEHGNIFNWVNKKKTVESKGLKYIHANEVYLTEHNDRERGLIRDNYHYMLIAKNWDGVKELNKLTSISNDKLDGHYYYNPRVTFEELFNTSDNIIMTSACLASPLWRALKNDNKQMLNMFMDFFVKNKHRMFFEIQYHSHPEQKLFNQHLYELSKETGIPLIAGTDTHALNRDQAEARKILMKAKGATYGDEDSFDLTFKTYPELVRMFEEQSAIPRSAYLEAIYNTNVMANMVEEFTLDKSAKYPKIHEDSEKVFKEKINIGVKEHGINKFQTEKRQEYFKRIREEFDTYKAVGAIDYMLLQKDVVDWAHSNGIYQGYGRGSVNGSLIAYLLKITEMDSIKHKLNFFRFLNPERISLADIDLDWPPSKRQDVIDYVASIPGIHFSEIITFNTIALKGAIREVGRALGMELSLVDEIAKSVFKDEKKKDTVDRRYREQYPELFKYVDLVQGVIMSIGSHPSGYVVSPISLDDNIGLCFTKESKYPVSQINMKELDGLNYVKLDILGLDNIEIINETCKLAGIDRLVPDNMDVNDENVWNSIRESGLGIFQWESVSAQAYLKDLLSPETIHKIKQQHPNFSYIELFSIGNGAIRPSGDSYRQALANGIFKDHGHSALNKFLENTIGYLVYQEQIMNFLVEFCDFSMAESDSVRRGLSKKEGTEKFLPEIRKRFINKMIKEYQETEEAAISVLEPFLQVIDDAQRYGFSDNHSNPYSHIGYGNGYLRYYYPLAFLTVMLNINKDDIEKTGQIIEYAKTRGIEISPIKFGKSGSSYSYNETDNMIYKGLESIKFLNANIANELLQLSKNKYSDFMSLLADVTEKTSVNSKQLKILIRLNFFSEFGNSSLLLKLHEEFSEGKIKYGKNLKSKLQRLESLIEYEHKIRKEDSIPDTLPNDEVMFHKEMLGYADIKYPHVSPGWCVLTELDTKYSPKLTLYNLKTGQERIFKMDKKTFNVKDNSLKINKGDLIRIDSFIKKQRQVPDGKGGFKPTDQTDVWITGYTKYSDKETLNGIK
ncbi:DNA polymerase III subunit alpha [Paenibacillus sp. XY044]|uniref:DNA polymerase III subunit alpha n=1 Tax=Paenibacillus sp. XY044 TaxID=2026089 RepID=UPI0015C6518E|nr:DNA polymerase III subunit alpha [Paenibacillus sp. XY044]